MYHVDPIDNSIVIDSFDKGIGTSPYSGLTDAKSVNLSTVPGEASVSFSSAPVFLTPNYVANTQGSLVTTSGGLFEAPASLKLEARQWIIFSSIGTATGTVAINVQYELVSNSSSGSNVLYSLVDVSGSTATVTGASATSTFSTISVGIINYFQNSSLNNYALDSNGRVWSDKNLSQGAGNGLVSATNSWTYLGNPLNSGSNGNGLLLYKSVTNGTGRVGVHPSTFDEWLFVWSNGQIDYTAISSAGVPSSLSWVQGWNYSLTTGTTTGHSDYLNTGNSTKSHHALQTPDTKVNFCDGNYIGNWYQNPPASLLTTDYTGFDPTTPSTYTQSTLTAILPAYETAQCLAFVNQYLLIGTTSNIIYPWNLIVTNNTYSVPLILLPESNTVCMVTVGNNAYIFAGNRGNIYITNGSQASPFAKVPDHLSNVTEPYIIWGAGLNNNIGVSPQAGCYNKNRLYFGFTLGAQGGGSVAGTGGVWCVDLTGQMIYNAQQVSQGSYSNFIGALAMLPNYSTYAAGLQYGSSVGYGLIISWGTGVSNGYGIDVDVTAPYTGGQSWITSDMIPVGTLLNPTTAWKIEFKLAKPLVSGETVQILTGKYLDMTYASFVSQFTTNTVGIISDTTANHGGMKDQQYQWILVQAILTSTASSPSYNRITEMRISGGAKKQTGYFAVA